MKSTIILFILGFLAYEAYQYYEDRPAAPVIVTAPRVAYQATPEPAPAAPEPPDATAVTLASGRTLTHAKAKEVSAGGILFLCDQGLVKVAMKDLPGPFQEYYGPLAATPAPTPSPTASPTSADAAPSPTPTPVPVIHNKPERTPLEDAQATVGFYQACEALRKRIEADQSTIDHWYKQSSYVQDGLVSEAQFNTAKSDRDAATLQLNELLATGP